MRRLSSPWCRFATNQVVNQNPCLSDQKRFVTDGFLAVWIYHCFFAAPDHTKEIKALKEQVAFLSDQVSKLNKDNNGNPAESCIKNDGNDKKEIPVIHQEGPRSPGQ